MQPVHGFMLEREVDLAEYGARARLWRHTTTGASLLSIINNDENKVFGVSLRTPPKDSTGVAHILEHSVLCGSRKYPVKEPFVELLKGSLQTFLNAFTFPDKTCYPVASQNSQDFFNLMDVYLDAVFHPRITEYIFKQEGRHLEADSPEGPFYYKGVVYNEMKGAYSSPDGLMAEYSQRSLFPDTTYGFDSGGDPAVIPDLTYEQFMDFHRRYYHPSNARFYLYGDVAEEDGIRKIAEFVGEYERLEPDSDIDLQAPFSESASMTEYFAASTDHTEAKRAMFCVNWLLPESKDPQDIFLFQMLEHILIEMSASPLRKALNDSDLGEDLAGVGLETELKQMFFSTGLKGIDPADTGRIKQVVVETLEALAGKRDGPRISNDLIEAAVNSLEFDLRENNAGRFPRGLLLMLRALNTWLYDVDPFALLAFEQPLQTIKQRLAAGEPVFQDLIQRWFLQNPHRSEVLLLPDEELQSKLDENERKRVEQELDGLSAADREIILQEAEMLKKMQETPDPIEALESIPRLTVEDLDREIKRIPEEVKTSRPAEILLHDLETAGVFYVDVGFHLQSVPGDLLSLVPVFGKALTESGTARRSFEQLNIAVAAKTGGINPYLLLSDRLEGDEPVSMLLLRGKSTTDKVEDLLSLMQEMLLEADFSDKSRFRRIVLEEKADMEQRLVPAGHIMVASRLKAGFSYAARLSEALSGVEQLFFLRTLLKRIDDDWDAVRENLESIRKRLIGSTNAVVNVTIDDGKFARLESGLQSFVDALPKGDFAEGQPDFSELPAHEGLVIPAGVNYVGKAVNVYEAGYGYHGSLNAVVKNLRNGFLWDEIRVKGGAYGAFCLFDRFSGVLALLSYRDPNIDKTLQTFDACSEYLAQADFSKSEVEKAVIGAIGEMDTHLLPDAKGLVSLNRKLVGESDAYRQRIRDELLSTDAGHFKGFAEYMARLKEHGKVVVMGNASGLETARAKVDMTTTKVL